MSLSTSMLGFESSESSEPRAQYSITMYAAPSWMEAPMSRQTFGWRSFASILISSRTLDVRVPSVVAPADEEPPPPLEDADSGEDSTDGADPPSARGAPALSGSSRAPSSSPPCAGARSSGPRVADRSLDAMADIT